MTAKRQSLLIWGFALIVAVIIAVIFFSNRSNSTFVSAYEIGDQGPAGGTIFYVDSTSKFADFDYLEAAPATCEAEKKLWALNADDLSAAINEVSGWESDSLGQGRQSTEAMLATGENFYNLDTASGYSNALDCGGKSDWFVPSKTELDLMYENLAAKSLGEFTDGYYWSSSSYLAGRAWNRPFSEGVSFDGNKDGNFAVRPIRSF